MSAITWAQTTVKKILFRNECTQVIYHRNNITIKTGEETRVPAEIQDGTVLELLSRKFTWIGVNITF